MLNTDENNISNSDQYLSSGLDSFVEYNCIVSEESLHCRSISVELSAMILISCRTSLFGGGGAILFASLKDNSNEHASPLFVG